MAQDKVTIRYEVWEGDTTKQFISSMPKIGITEVHKIEFMDHQWVVTSDEPDASSKWTGRSEYRQIAILNYLQARLGHFEVEREDERTD